MASDVYPSNSFNQAFPLSRPFRLGIPSIQTLRLRIPLIQTTFSPVQILNQKSLNCFQGLVDFKTLDKHWIEPTAYLRKEKDHPDVYQPAGNRIEETLHSNMNFLFFRSLWSSPLFLLVGYQLKTSFFMYFSVKKNKPILFLNK